MIRPFLSFQAVLFLFLIFIPGLAIAELQPRIIKILSYDQLDYWCSMHAGRIGDVNGDGIDDIIVSSWRERHPNVYVERFGGVVCVYFGRQSWPDANLTFQQADLVFAADSDEDEEFGFGLPLNHGDLDGDGFDDIVVTALGRNKGYIWYGRESGWPAKGLPASVTCDAILTNDFQYNPDCNGCYPHLGYTLDIGGDNNGDGLNDLLIPKQNFDTQGNDYWLPGKGTRFRGSVNLDNGNATSLWYRHPGNWWVTNTGDPFCTGLDSIYAADSPSTVTYGRRSGFPQDMTPQYSADHNFSLPWGWMRHALFMRDADFCMTAVFQAARGLPEKVWAARNLPSDERTIRIEDHATEIQSGASWQINWGQWMAKAGDVNLDGYEDFLVGTYGNNYVLLLPGRPQWDVETLQAPDIMLWDLPGYPEAQVLGLTIANAGDVDGDAVDDWVFTGGGFSLLVFPWHNQRPNAVSSVRLFSDPSYSTPLTAPASLWSKVWVEVSGVDADLNAVNVCEVIAQSTGNVSPRGLKVRCIETGKNTGVFRGSFEITNAGTSYYMRRLRCSGIDTITVTSVEDSNVSFSLDVRDPDWLKPKILLAGYWNTSLQAEIPGTLSVFALTNAPSGARLSFFYEGLDVGVSLGLLEDSTTAYSIKVPLTADAPAKVLLELGKEGTYIALWPYLEVKQ